MNTVDISLSVSDATQKTDVLMHTIIFEDVSGVVQVGNGKKSVVLSDLFTELRLLLQSNNPSIEDINIFEEHLKKAISEMKKNTDENSLEIVKNLEKILDVFLQWKKNKNSDSLNDLKTELFYIEKQISPESAPLLSDKSIASMVNLSNIVEELEKEISDNGGSILDENGESIESIQEKLSSFEKIMKDLETEITIEDLLYDDFQQSKIILEKLKEGKNMSSEEINNSLSQLQESLQKMGSTALESSQRLWKPLAELGENINKSLILEFETPTTTLNIYGGEKYIQVNEEIEIFIFTRNADGSFYTGPLEMKVIEGNGKFIPQKIKSVEGRAVGSFIPLDAGVTLIEITALETVSGSLSETLTFFVQE